MKLSSEEVIKYLIEIITVNLKELSDLKSEFVFGEQYAYVECLEVIKFWEKSKDYGLTGNIEKIYNIK